MNKKPPDLPNIEDATLRACLAPLMDAMTPRAEMAVAAVPAAQRAPMAATRSDPAVSSPPAHGAANSNENRPPSPGLTEVSDQASADLPKTLAEWRSLADDDFGMFRTIELFLAMTEAELEIAAAEFPKQIGGTIARIDRIKRRLSAQYDTVTTVTALLRRALARAAAGRNDGRG